jgi:hypothetical protein
MSRENKLIKTLKLVPKLSLFSNTRINNFVNTLKGREKKEERFTGTEEIVSSECDSENQWILITLRLTVTLIVTIIALSLYTSDNIKIGTAGLLSILSVILPEISLIALVILSISGTKSADMTAVLSDATTQPVPGRTGTVSGSKYYHNNMNEKFFLSETPE